MKTHLRLAILLLGLLIAPLKLWAQGASFSCDGTFYQVRQIGTGATAFSALYVVDRSTSAYTTTAYTFGGTSTTGSLGAGVVVNALAYNPLDSYLYALAYPADNGTPPATISLYRIGQGGVQNLGATNLPSAQYNSGTIDKQGNYYLTTRGSANVRTSSLFRLDLTNFSTVLTAHDEYPLVNSAGGSVTGGYTDVALNPKDNALYGVDLLGNLEKIVVTTTGGVTRGVVTDINSSSTSADIFGSSFFDVAGNLYAYSNSGGIYLIDQTTGAATSIGTASSAPNSDGASCINPDQRIDVVKELTSVSVSTNGATNNSREEYYDVAFAVRVKNTGTATATNVQVSDFLGVNGTFGATALSIRVAPAITNYGINGAQAPTLSANNAFSGLTTEADLLTGNQALTAGQSAMITFTVRLTFVGRTPVIPPTVFQNTAYASTTSGTSVNQGHVQLGNGTILPPGNLLAEDESTNSAALPTTANGDAPQSTPVRLTPAIEGNVFEDANYGGGAGRSQANSNGEGVTGAIVELYNATTNAFVASVATDAAGNYVFTGTGVTASTVYRVRVVNSTVVSTRPGSIAGLLPVQTFLNGNVNRVGGENPNEPDASARSGTQTLLQVEAAIGTTIQSLTPLTGAGSVSTPASGPLVGVDFGFNFSTVVNTNDAGQGSLRQFILNSNALTNTGLDQDDSFQGAVAGVEFANFVIPDGTTTTNGLRAGVTAASGYNAVTGFTITLASDLPIITDANTRINGNRIATGDKVAPVAGTSTGPEVTINFNNFSGLETTAANTRFVSLGLTGARGTSTSTTGDVSQGAAITLNGAATTGSVVNDVTAYNNATAGVRLENGATGVTVQSSILRDGLNTVGATGTTATSGFGIVLEGAVNNTITGNTISNNAGNGIALGTGNPGTAVTNTGNLFQNNTVSGNGAGTATADNAGIRIRFGQDNLFLTNTITGNDTDGIIANGGTSGNRFSQNSFSNHVGTGDLGIDLTAGPGFAGDNETLNADGKTTASGANGMLNFPVLTQLSKDATNLLVTGYAPAGAVVEFFVADVQTATFGEGATYLASRTEGNATDDADNKISNYSFSGFPGEINQGSETNARRFFFTIPLSSLNATQLTALNAANARLTATATVLSTTLVNGVAVGNTSEFSGNIAVSATPLPVELKAFEVAAANANANLTWTTASEKNNDHFDVERSFDGRTFERISQVRGQGTTSRATNYRFTDVNVGRKHQGVVYYRLQQVDTDGTTSTSPVRTVSFPASLATEVALSVYPNPAAHQDRTATLDLSALPQGSYQATLLDATGRSLGAYEVQGGENKVLDVQQLPAGTYLILVRGNGYNLSQRLIRK